MPRSAGIPLAIAFAAFAAAPALSACPPSVTWTAKYSGPTAYDDLAYGLAVNPRNGEIYVVGSQATSITENEWMIRRYSSTGSLLGSTTYNGSGNGNHVCTYVAIDDSDNVIVAGSEEVTGQGPNWLVRKYDPTLATVEWSFTVNGSANGYDEATSVAVIPGTGGDVAVAGYVTTALNGENAMIVRLSSTGYLLWSTEYDGLAHGDDSAQCVVADTSGSIFICGYVTVAGQDKDWVIIKYSSSRTTPAWLWRNTYDDANHSEDVAYSIAIDPRDHHVVVAGYETRPDRLEGKNWMVRSYSPNLNGLKTRKYSEGNDEWASAVAVDANGYVYVAGAADRWWVNQGKNWMVQKLDPDLTQVRTMTYGTAGAYDDVPQGIALDASGNFYVSGYESTTYKGWDWLLYKAAQPTSCSNVPSAVSSVDHSPVAENETLTLDLKVTALGTARTGILPFVASTLLTGDVNTSTYDTLSEPNPPTEPSLAVGASRDFLWTYRVHGDGTGQFSNWAEYDIGGGFKVSTDIAEASFTFSTLAGARRRHAPPAHGIQIRNNVVRVGANKLGQVFVNGAKAGGSVELAVFTSSGIAIGRLPAVTADAAGQGYASFDGTVDGKPLKTGVYYIVATGGVTDRKPVMVINENK